jgi:RimJ/RimL family protein N-acetyltransferase
MNNLKKETEIGIIIGNRDYWNKGYGRDALKTLTQYLFETTSFERLHLKTLVNNIRAQKCFLQSSFQIYGQVHKTGFDYILMDLRRSNWENLH